jgi:uncharacterized protein YdhG (YjbR/CyaY superfamily)
MQSAAKDVTAYLQEAPPDRLPCLRTLRELCLEMLPGYEEAMEYGMPSYKKNGLVEVAFASQKGYISLYILKQEVLDANRESLAGLSVGKGCIRYTRPAKMDFAVVRKLLSESFESPTKIC